MVVGTITGVNMRTRLFTILVIFYVVPFACAQSSQPAPDEIDVAQSELQSAKSACMAKIIITPEYIKAKETLDIAIADLDAARENKDGAITTAISKAAEKKMQAQAALSGIVKKYQESDLNIINATKKLQALSKKAGQTVDVKKKQTEQMVDAKKPENSSEVERFLLTAAKNKIQKIKNIKNNPNSTASKQEIARLSKLKYIYPSLPSYSLKIGDMGKMPDSVYVYPKDVPVGPYMSGRVYPDFSCSIDEGICFVFQVINDNETLVKWGGRYEILLLRNFHHTEIDGHPLKTGNTVFKVVDRKTYNSKGGLNTVYVVEPVKIE